MQYTHKFFIELIGPTSNIHVEVVHFSMQIEMMSDAIDETLDKDEAEEETEELTNQVKYRKPDCFHFCFLSVG